MSTLYMTLVQYVQKLSMTVLIQPTMSLTWLRGLTAINQLCQGISSRLFKDGLSLNDGFGHLCCHFFVADFGHLLWSCSPFTIVAFFILKMSYILRSFLRNNSRYRNRLSYTSWDWANQKFAIQKFLVKVYFARVKKFFWHLKWLNNPIHSRARFNKTGATCNFLHFHACMVSSSQYRKHSQQQ